jgi:hypothetical protein
VSTFVNTPPFIWFFIAALFAGLLNGKARILLLLVPVLSGLNLFINGGSTGGITYEILGFILDIYHAYRRVYCPNLLTTRGR